MTQLQNSAFKTRAGSVPDISKILPEPGAIVLNELDCKIYIADAYGWGRPDLPFSPIRIFVPYDGVTQFTFKFQAPITSTLDIYDGDGTMTQVAGNDLTDVTHTTTYATAGTYFFYVLGDVLDIAYLNIQDNTGMIFNIKGLSLLLDLYNFRARNTFVYGDIAQLAGHPSLTSIVAPTTNISGNIDGLRTNTILTALILWATDIEGDVGLLDTLINVASFELKQTAVSGDASKLKTNINLNLLWLQNTNITFKSSAAWAFTGSHFYLEDCNLTPTMVDNILISLAAGTTAGATITLAGNNAKRTSASDAAFTQLDAANTLTVNS